MECHERLKELREEKNYIQQYVASELNVVQRTYSKYERGEVEITASTVIKLARLFNVSTDYLLGITNVRREYPKE